MKTKDILNEWKSYLNKELLVEVSIKRFQEQHPDFDTSSFNSQLRGNTDYLDIISNTINSGEQHGPDDYIQQFEFYKNSIEPNRKDQEFLTINIPGGESVSLVDKVNPGSCTATYNDIQQFQQARMFILGKASKNKLAAAYEKVLNEANEDDFELIADDSNWIVFYPKSVKGSIALARSYWDGSRVVYDKTFNPSKGLGQNTGVIKWCTSVSGQGNMFLNYHRRLNLHMYYCINKNLNSKSDSNRKLCISLAKVRGEVSYKAGNASVNGNNTAVSEQNAKSYLGNIYNLLVKDASQDKRLEIDLNSYYESINVNQYVIMRNANEENIEDFIREFRQILNSSRESDKIAIVASKDPNESIRKAVASSTKSPAEVLALLANDSIENVRANVAKNNSAPAEVLALLANDSIENVRANVAQNNNSPAEVLALLANDSSGRSRALVAKNDSTPAEVLELLANDSSENVRVLTAQNNNTPSEVLKLLANDSSELARTNVARNKRTPAEVLGLLANDSSENVRANVAQNNNTPIEALKNLVNDKDKSVKLGISRNDIFRNNTYLEKDPSGFIIRKLVEDKSETLRAFVAGLNWIYMDNQFDDVVEKLTKDKNREVLIYLISNLNSHEEIKEKRPQIIDKIASNIKKDVLSYFKRNNLKNKDLSELINKFISFSFCLNQYADTMAKFVIKKTKEGFKIDSYDLFNLLSMLSDKESAILENERNQMHFAKLVVKSDFRCPKIFLKNKKITKKTYMYIAKRFLPAKGPASSSVYTDLHNSKKTYIMLQDPEVASMFVNFAQKSVLSKVFNKITKLVNLKNNDEDLNNIEEYREYDMTISNYDEYNLSLEESIDLAIKAGPVLYNAMQNSSNAMSIKKKRFDFEKALKQQNLIESKRLTSLTITETLLKKYINLIIS